jgi:diguanylate cyclase (GGDEF)-like protein
MQLNRNVRPEELRRQIRSLEGREFLLQISALLLSMLVGAGFIAVKLPYISWLLGTSGIHDYRFLYIPLGCIALGGIFGLYKQRQALWNGREQLVRAALGTEGAENLRLIDVLTGLFNRRYFDQFASKDVATAERLGLTLTFLMVDVRDFRSLNSRFGRAAGDNVLMGVGELLRTTFRPTDTLIRYAGDDFLVLMLGCNEQQAQGAAERLLAKVDHWNQANVDKGWKLSLRCHTAAYSNRTSIAALLETLDQKMREQKYEQPTSEVIATRERP